MASVWEIAIKVGLGKWPAAEPLLADIEARLPNMQAMLLPISVAHVRHAGLLQSPIAIRPTGCWRRRRRLSG
jgi:PIN domain nuclease of toxin-antitoxin system